MPIYAQVIDAPLNLKEHKLLLSRLTEIVRPELAIEDKDNMHEHPSQESISYENEMVGVVFHGNHSAFNILMSDGTTGGLEYTTKKEIKMKKRE